MKKLLKILLFLCIFCLLSFASFLLYLTFTDYTPEAQTLVYQGETADELTDTLDLSLLIWNIGYAGLNKEMDFFYDRGKQVRPEEEIAVQNLQGILKILQKQKENDFILLQEVDKHSRRSYYMNQFDSISLLFSDRHSDFATNYKVSFIPQPLLSPVGKVFSGLMTVSKYKPEKSTRHSFPEKFAYPMKLAMLDQCFLVNRYNLQNKKQLLIVNIQNSIYDKGNLRDEQMNYLKSFLKKEYRKGNYIIVGGDWKLYPPGFNPHFKKDIQDNKNRKDIPVEYLKNWKWAYDNSSPTSRSMKKRYVQGETKTTLIDFFLLSPNISLKKVKNIDIGFELSDHNPVQLRVQLK